MESSLVAMEHLVRKENEALKGTTNELKNDKEPSNNEGESSGNAGGG